jgi:hypothetical protein
LVLLLLAAGACATPEPEPVPEPSLPADSPADVAARPPRDVSGLTLPRQGESFRIGDELWQVDAVTVSLPTHGVQEDTQVIDVTIQARRAGAAAPEYLGDDDAGSPAAGGAEQSPRPPR